MKRIITYLLALVVACSDDDQTPTEKLKQLFGIEAGSIYSPEVAVAYPNPA